MSLYVDIEKDFGGFTLSAGLEAGEESVALLGQSGSGKSLTLKCIAGIETPDKGVIAIDGKTVFDSTKRINMPPQQRGTGFLFQNYALFPTMSVRDNIAIDVKKQGQTKSHMVNSLLKSMELELVAHHYPSQISGGQKQRTAMARAIASEPAIFLLDEPFSAIDSHLRGRLERELMPFIANTGKTVVYVTHNSGEAYRMCGKIAVMSKGRIVECGDRKTVFSSPKTLEAAIIAGFTNISPAVKIGECTVFAKDWGIELTANKPVPEAVKYVAVKPSGIKTGQIPADCSNGFCCHVRHVVCEPDRLTAECSIFKEPPEDYKSTINTVIVEVFDEHVKQGDILSAYIEATDIAVING